MKHAAKVDRAIKLSVVGEYPSSCQAMLNHLPNALIERLTAADLAKVLDSLWECSRKSKMIAERDIVTEGVVWDAKNQKLIKLQYDQISR